MGQTRQAVKQCQPGKPPTRNGQKKICGHVEFRYFQTTIWQEEQSAAGGGANDVRHDVRELFALRTSAKSASAIQAIDGTQSRERSIMTKPN
jgi:hypothetical protein